MQSHDTLMCFEEHTNNFLTILMFAGQFDPHLFCFKATVQTQVKYIIFIVYMLQFWHFTILEREKKCFFSLFPMLKKTFSDSDGKSEQSFIFS